MIKIKAGDKVKFLDYTGQGEHLIKWKRVWPDFWHDWTMHEGQIATIKSIRSEYEIEVFWNDGHNSLTEISNLIMIEPEKREIKIYGIAKFCEKYYAKI